MENLLVRNTPSPPISENAADMSFDQLDMAPLLDDDKDSDDDITTLVTAK